jgi:DNA-binding response OmpR family regulator
MGGERIMQRVEKQYLMGHYTLDNTILVVEDDDSIGSVLVEALSMETSYDALLVCDGFQALNALRSLKPLLVITDYRLPHMDGLELYDRVHAMTETANVPTIIMSAYMPEDEVRKRHLCSLHKPFELDDLLNLIEQLLNKR